MRAAEPWRASIRRLRGAGDKATRGRSEHGAPLAGEPSGAVDHCLGATSLDPRAAGKRAERRGIVGAREELDDEPPSSLRTIASTPSEGGTEGWCERSRSGVADRSGSSGICGRRPAEASGTLAVRLASRRAAVTSIAAREKLKLSRQSMRQPLVQQRTDASSGNEPVNRGAARSCLTRFPELAAASTRRLVLMAGRGALRACCSAISPSRPREVIEASFARGRGHSGAQESAC